MIRSLYSGVAGLTTHQTRMDVIGNNIANVNTYGFKSSRTTFSDVYYQSIRTETAGTETFAGNNASAVGYGDQVASIDRDMSQSSFQSTNRTLDIALSGDGFFATANFSSNPDGSLPADTTSPDSITYTRMGNFGLDSVGNLVTSNNRFVLGARNSIDGLLKVGDSSAKALQMVELGDNNNDGKLTSGDYTYGNTINVNDLIQRAYNIFTDPSNGVLYKYQTYEVDEEGNLTAEDPILCNIKGEPILDDGGEPIEYDLSEDGEASEVPEGAVIGEFTYSYLAAFDIGADGVMTVTYNNQLKSIGRIEVTVFDNPEGLVEAGETAFSESAASGAGKVRKPGDQGAATTISKKLEMSNVNLANEFSDMIVTQRGFQANARIITTSDSMLEELVNLKR